MVYYGPALSGKTTNLQAVHYFLQDTAASELLTLDTQNDRTLFFDLLPLEYLSPTGFKVKHKIFTVPGQVIHASTRKMVLKGADGVVFVADSQSHLNRENNQSYRDLINNLSFHKLEDIPMVIQFNKRDLPDIMSNEEIDAFASRINHPVMKAAAINGTGVLETFSQLIKDSFRVLDQRYRLQEKFKIDERELLKGIFANIRNG